MVCMNMAQGIVNMAQETVSKEVTSQELENHNSKSKDTRRSQSEDGFITVQGHQPRHFVVGSNTINEVNKELHMRNTYEPLVENIDSEQFARLFP